MGEDFGEGWAVFGVDLEHAKNEVYEVGLEFFGLGEFWPGFASGNCDAG